MYELKFYINHSSRYCNQQRIPPSYKTPTVAANGVFLSEKVFLEICKIHRKTPVPQSLLINLEALGLQLHYKRDCSTGIFL